MKNKQMIEVANIKCGGCALTIKKALIRAGFLGVEVFEQSGKIYFLGDRTLAEKILIKLGYPIKGTKEADDFFLKVKSFSSCARGKFSKLLQ